MLLCVLAAAARGAAANSVTNCSLQCDASGKSQAYVDWEFGEILNNVFEFMGTHFDVSTATTWQQFYELKSRSQADQLTGWNSGDAGNTTLSIHVAGKVDDSWDYTSLTTCATVLSKSCNSYTQSDLPGTGLVPILCGVSDQSKPAAAGNVLCNAFYRSSIMLLYPDSMIEPLGTLSNSLASFSFNVGSFKMPVLRSDLLIEDGEHFEWVNLDKSSFIHVDPLVEYMTSQQVQVCLSSLRGMASVAQCTGSDLPLMLPLQGMLLGGAIFYCFEMQYGVNASDIVVMTWNISPIWASATSCGRIWDKRRFMLVLYGGTELSNAIPFQYIYTVEEATSLQWEVTCSTRCYHVNDNGGSAKNFDRLYSLEPGGYMQSIWGTISQCVNNTWNNTWYGPPTSDGQYQFEIIKGVAGGINLNGINDTLFPHFSPQSMGPLQGVVNASLMLRLTSADDSGMCLLKQVSATPGIVGDGSANLGTAVISSLLALGTVSGFGSKNLPLIRQQINDMGIQFSTLTVPAAVNAAITSVVAAYGFNAFTLKVKFLTATSSMLLVIRVLVSLIEAALASTPAIVGMWALGKYGKACRVAQWLDSLNDTPCDYESCSHYIFTSANICGTVDHWVWQWLVLSVGCLLATALIMFRWHFAKGGSVADMVQVDRETPSDRHSLFLGFTRWSRTLADTIGRGLGTIRRWAADVLGSRTGGN